MWMKSSGQAEGMMRPNVEIGTLDIMDGIIKKAQNEHLVLNKDVHPRKDSGVYKPLYFLLVFVLYILIIVVNLTLIFIVTVDKSLHEPMYIFICNLCANGLYGTVGFYPKLLLDLQSDIHTIAHRWCLLQTYVIYSSGLSEMTVLTVMCYDRYVAICRPLQYHSIMFPRAALKLLVLAWAYSLLVTAVAIILTSRIPFCGSHIYKLFCDNPSMLMLGCYRSVANQDSGVYKPLYFLLVFFLYILIIVVNLTLIFIVTVDKSLHEPMYIFICNLCANGLYGIVGFYPKFLLDLQSDIHTITYNWCMIQTFVIYSSALCEMTVLTVMSYDRSVAICRPLQYHNIVTPHAVLKLLVVAWAYSLLVTAVAIILTSRIPFCGSHIHKLFCDNASMVLLGCYRAITNQVWSMVVISVYLIQFILIIISYARIVRVCISSTEGRAKFSKTCVPHIVVMVIYILTALFDVFYSWDGSVNLPIGVRNALAIQFLILPPLLNPLIYGLQLPQIRKNDYMNHYYFYEDTIINK
ncbi:olfactory receptor 6N1-like [Sardina pilchardus]|uniref:olfactory receptor 6N1-like n=1 Tax=Sardina pilchardus TaxID=27697 RepID=UPI002E143489